MFMKIKYPVRDRCVDLSPVWSLSHMRRRSISSPLDSGMFHGIALVASPYNSAHYAPSLKGEWLKTRYVGSRKSWELWCNLKYPMLFMAASKWPTCSIARNNYSIYTSVAISNQTISIIQCINPIIDWKLSLISHEKGLGACFGSLYFSSNLLLRCSLQFLHA